MHEAERLAREKEILGFFISGHPLERYRPLVELFGTRTTATLGEWSEHQVAIAAVVTAVKRQTSKKTGKEYARVVVEDFHGTAETIVFPDAWAKLNQLIGRLFGARPLGGPGAVRGGGGAPTGRDRGGRNARGGDTLVADHPARRGGDPRRRPGLRGPPRPGPALY